MIYCLMTWSITGIKTFLFLESFTFVSVTVIFPKIPLVINLQVYL